MYIDTIYNNNYDNDTCIQVTEVKVEDDPITVSYGSDRLDPHMDIPMYESYPGILVLQCLRLVSGPQGRVRIYRQSMIMGCYD